MSQIYVCNVPERVAERFYKSNKIDYQGLSYLRSPKSVYHERFMGLNNGDLILLYIGKNTIAYIGEITSPPFSITRQKFTTPRKHVKWWDTPSYFLRDQLPGWIVDNVGKPQRFYILGTGNHSIIDFKNYLRNQDLIISGSGLDNLSENMIKIAFRKYLRRNFDELEKGLTIVRYEDVVGSDKRLDFFATARDGKPVIIECKGIAYPESVYQLVEYGDRYYRDKGNTARLMLVAYQFTDSCVDLARKNDIELIQCKMKFNVL